MKFTPVTLIACAAFAGGLGLGLLATPNTDAPAPAGLAPLDEARAARARGPSTDAAEAARAAAQAIAAKPATPKRGAGSRSAPRDGAPLEPASDAAPKASTAAAPPPPPRVPHAMLEAGEHIAAELERRDSRGAGPVTNLVADFDNAGERADWEQRRRRTWQLRLEREIDIKVRNLRARVGLSPNQEAALRELLGQELQERTRLVDLLSAKKLSQSQFASAVQANVSGAREQLAGLLTGAQIAVYDQLAPREQVLRQGLK